MEVPVDVDRDEAARLAREELTDPRYAAAEPSWLQQAADWLGERFTDLLTGTILGLEAGWFWLLVLVVVLVVVLVAVRLRVGPLRGRARVAAPVYAGKARTAAEHRAAAESALAAGDLGTAVRERFRALVRGLEERGILDERSGRTADEAARDAARLLPDLAGDLAAAARLFDEVHYGDRAPTADGYRELAALDDRARATRPVSA
ncbi:DUF4129 domain-containing protein [Amycolatopsis suaedae]|uniref:DUF4129 domain-containing protein n=1 Tax=Amycolatopsis suaedae TaxID=2510978 RepID=A0A4Q7J8B0_9PSEU|nr:DUF4129 domain-containing protein [Amycolatopsis suaedae]RZQ62613.1 DUF4129 domain-containing protein [Amycolatopsis suaedae]